MVRLSQRMQALADMVTPGNVLCDVGCDHGFLPIYLVQKKIISRAIAMAVATGPLSAAKEHIASEGLSDKISTRLSDGLSELGEAEADTVLIAGMGGGLVLHILSENPDRAKSLKELILQPQSELYEVRNFLVQEGYELLDEDMVLEVRYGGEVTKREEPTEQQLYFGTFLIQRKHPVLKQYLLRERAVTEKVLKQLEAQPATDVIEKRRQEVKSYRDLVEKTLEEMQ